MDTQDKSNIELSQRTPMFLYWVSTQDKSKHDVTENIPFRMFYIECAREDEHMNSATLQKLSNSSYGFASPTLNIINMHHKSKTQQPTSPGLVAAVFLETSNPSAYSSWISSRYQFFSTSSHPPREEAWTHVLGLSLPVDPTPHSVKIRFAQILARLVKPSLSWANRCMWNDSVMFPRQSSSVCPLSVFSRHGVEGTWNGAQIVCSLWLCLHHTLHVLCAPVTEIQRQLWCLVSVLNSYNIILRLVFGSWWLYTKLVPCTPSWFHD